MFHLLLLIWDWSPNQTWECGVFLSPFKDSNEQPSKRSTTEAIDYAGHGDVLLSWDSHPITSSRHNQIFMWCGVCLGYCGDLWGATPRGLTQGGLLTSHEVSESSTSHEFRWEMKVQARALAHQHPPNLRRVRKEVVEAGLEEGRWWWEGRWWEEHPCLGFFTFKM